MPHDATSTRERLIRAGEHLFARRGIDGARTGDIVALSGQANDSAVHYHFGSRRGLLVAIIDQHMRRMEDQRKPDLDALGPTANLREVLAAVVEPVAAELASPDGRDFLRIIVQLAGHAGMRSREFPEPVAGTALAAQLALVEQRCRMVLPERVVLERLAMMITMLTAALAERAHRIDQRMPVLLGDEDFVSHLVSMLTAAMTASVGKS